MVQWMVERDLEDQGFQRPEMIVLCRGFAFTIEDLLVLICKGSGNNLVESLVVLGQ